MSKKILRVFNALTTLLVAAAALLAILLVGVRAVGLTPFAVLSGSMEPSYHVGSLIYVKNAVPENIRVGDPITFVLNEDLLVATHRVIEIDEANQHFYTKGDANEAPDAMPVHFNNLLGRPVFSIPKLGYVSSLLGTKKGMLLAGSLAAIILILVFVPDLLRLADKSDKKANKQQQ